jgi:sugar lactone lactonase YvrE
MKQISRSFLFFIALGLGVACSSDDDNGGNGGGTSTDGLSGVMVANEGPFGSGNGSLSVYDPATKSLKEDVFLEANGVPVGNIFQSITDVGEGFAFVANNSGLIRITDKNAELIETIDEVASPRYALQSGDYLLVSDWSQNEIHFISTNDWNIETSVATGLGPDKMLRTGDNLWVVNPGGFGVDSTVSIINLSSKSVTSTVTLTGAPNSLVEDAQGNIWVMCSGEKDWSDPANDKPGALFKLSSQGQVLARMDFTNPSQAPGKMAISPNKTTLYWLENTYGGTVYSMSTSDTELPSSPFVSGVNFYSLGVHPVSGNIFCGDAKDFASAGKVTYYSPSGSKMGEFSAGIIPGYFHFR